MRSAADATTVVLEVVLCQADDAANHLFRREVLAHWALGYRGVWHSHVSNPVVPLGVVVEAPAEIHVSELVGLILGTARAGEGHCIRRGLSDRTLASFNF